MTVTITANLKIESPNVAKSAHWTRKLKNNNHNRRILRGLWLALDEKPTTPCIVSFCRLYDPSKRQKQWDDDNWISGCKGIRDIIADFLIPGFAKGQADNPEYGLTFHYSQKKSTTTTTQITFTPTPP